ncbi:hypothetical protein [Escherichia coli]|uniref:hypothetical protein n=1 Tax=Escherichia coli TaxID=562 RepID=UPI00358DAB81
MESNIKGLVSAGHEMASELKAECGAVDMRSVAKLISDLATQLEVQLVRANALAAENAGLKSDIPLGAIENGRAFADRLESECLGLYLIDDREQCRVYELEERVKELDAREISLPERSSMLHRTDFHDDYQTVMAYKVSEVIAAIRAAGIRIKGE